MDKHKKSKLLGFGPKTTGRNWDLESLSYLFCGLNSSEMIDNMKKTQNVCFAARATSRFANDENGSMGCYEGLDPKGSWYDTNPNNAVLLLMAEIRLTS